MVLMNPFAGQYSCRYREQTVGPARKGACGAD